MEFHEKLIRLRKQNAFSQEELADKLGVSRQAISRWELGSTYPDVPNLLKICRLFNVSADYLINDNNDIQEKRVSEQPKILTENPPQDSGENKQNFFKPNRLLICGFVWLFAAFCWLIAAVINMEIMHLWLTGMATLLACANFCIYFKAKQKTEDGSDNHIHK